MRDSQDSKRGTLDEMFYRGEQGLVESTSSRMTGHQVRDGVVIPQSKFGPITSYLKELQEQKWKRACGKGGPVTG